MADAASYRRRANEFREMAAQTADPELVNVYLEMAREYDHLAERAENTEGHGAGHWCPHGKS